jgi:hypothetical protein
VYERFEWRLNIVNLTCCLTRLAQLTRTVNAGSSSSSSSSGSSGIAMKRRMVLKEQLALQKFLRRVLERVGELLSSADAATGAALLHSLSLLSAAGQVNCAAAAACLGSPWGAGGNDSSAA